VPGPGARAGRTAGITTLAGLALAARLLAPVEAGAQSGESGDAGAERPRTLSAWFVDPEDGWLDVSAFLDHPLGFVPVLVPITEPAVGYGVAGARVGIHGNEPASSGRPVPPDVLALGGLGTENGSWGAFGGYSAWWLDGHPHTLMGAGYAKLNFEFFGIGDGALRDHPARYTVEPLGGLTEVEYRFGETPVRAGLRYALAKVKARFEGGPAPPEAGRTDVDTRVGGFTASLT
jgi:hypothetical protein